jgi:hypothetical protein
MVSIGPTILGGPLGYLRAVSERCSWCGTDVEPDEGFRATEPIGDRVATFCRLEHAVPWIMGGAHWEAGRVVEEGDNGVALGVCALCGEDLGDARVLIVRHRGEHRIADGFCSVEHLLDWAKRGGRWRTGV